MEKGKEKRAGIGNRTTVFRVIRLGEVWAMPESFKPAIGGRWTVNVTGTASLIQTRDYSVRLTLREGKLRARAVDPDAFQFAHYPYYNGNDPRSKEEPGPGWLEVDELAVRYVREEGRPRSPLPDSGTVQRMLGHVNQHWLARFFRVSRELVRQRAPDVGRTGIDSREEPHPAVFLLMHRDWAGHIQGLANQTGWSYEYMRRAIRRHGYPTSGVRSKSRPHRGNLKRKLPPVEELIEVLGDCGWDAGRVASRYGAKRVAVYAAFYRSEYGSITEARRAHNGV